MHPGRYQPGQLRTFQRRLEVWRAKSGSERLVMFEQEHYPGRIAQSDFTHMDSLLITLGGIPFPHMVFHMVLTYSNLEAIRVCFSESFESLAEGIEGCLWQMGGTPRYHRTDNLSAAIRKLDAEGRKDFTGRYEALMQYYGMQPMRNTPGESHQNGDVEQSHHRFKEAVDQALRVRGSRDFTDRGTYEQFLQAIVRRRNQTRKIRAEADREALLPLPAQPLDPCREIKVRVSRFSTIQVLRNSYSVPSRLIGFELKVRVRAETLELYHGAAQVDTLPRLSGRHRHQINYRHVIWSLVRKPGAFAAWRYREELFPTTVFRQAYDALQAHSPARADREYLRILHLAARDSEAAVEQVLAGLLETQARVTYEAVREQVKPTPATAPAMTRPAIDLSGYDRLMGGQHG